MALCIWLITFAGWPACHLLLPHLYGEANIFRPLSLCCCTIHTEKPIAHLIACCALADFFSSFFAHRCLHSHRLDVMHITQHENYCSCGWGWRLPFHPNRSQIPSLYIVKQQQKKYTSMMMFDRQYNIRALSTLHVILLSNKSFWIEKNKIKIIIIDGTKKKNTYLYMFCYGFLLVFDYRIFSFIPHDSFTICDWCDQR